MRVRNDHFVTDLKDAINRECRPSYTDPHTDRIALLESEVQALREFVVRLTHSLAKYGTLHEYYLFNDVLPAWEPMPEAEPEKHRRR